MSNLRQSPYNLSRRDQKAMESILSQKEDGGLECVPLHQPSQVASPTFVFLRNGKHRFVIDMRRSKYWKLDPSRLPGKRRKEVL